MSYVSTAGGAFLEWLEGETLAGGGGADQVIGFTSPSQQEYAGTAGKLMASRNACTSGMVSATR